MHWKKTNQRKPEREFFETQKKMHTLVYRLLSDENLRRSTSQLSFLLKKQPWLDAAGWTVKTNNVEARNEKCKTSFVR